jgi:mannose-6-phosphate isomerase-like protein (cupin superfamily)
MEISVINLEDKARKIKELHAYKIIAKMNDYYFKLIKMKREFIWHKHPETDEVFMVFAGNLQIDLRDKILNVGKGELVVIPKGVEHKPSCQEECTVLLIEPAGTINTGDVGGSFTDNSIEWI